MPWETRRMNDEREIPGIAFGTLRSGDGDGAAENVQAALDLGFVHVDTALGYGNEVEAGQAIRQYPRGQVFVTTKWSCQGGLGAEESMHDSLKNLGLSYVDLYLMDHPKDAKLNIREAWARMEQIKAAGLARSIGVSNFDDVQLTELLEHAECLPVVNQIMVHPYVLRNQLRTMRFCAEHHIVVEGYSPLAPLTGTDGQVRYVVELIAKRKHVTPEMVLLAWAKAKGVVVVTASSKRWRLADYLKAGDLSLDADDTRIIDELGAGGAPIAAEKTMVVGTDVSKPPAVLGEEELVLALEAAEAGRTKATPTKTVPAGRQSRASAMILVAVCYLLWKVTWGPTQSMIAF